MEVEGESVSCARIGVSSLTMFLGEAEKSRYARQLPLSGFGEQGQERLKAACVRVVGSGAAMGPAALYLVQAGVGTLLLDAPDVVVKGSGTEWLCGPEDQNRPFAQAVADALLEASTFSQVRPYQQSDRTTAVLVCAESEDRRLSVADEARLADLPSVIVEPDGAVVVLPAAGPCYACAARKIDREASSTIETAALGALASLELILLMVGANGGSRARRIDVARGELSTTPISRVSGCPCEASSARRNEPARPGRRLE